MRPTDPDSEPRPGAGPGSAPGRGAGRRPGGPPGIEATGGVWAPGRRLLTAGLVSIVTVVAFESLAISTVMPLVEDDLGDLWLYGWVFSGFFLGSLVATVVAGRSADRLRPAVPFAIGLVLFLVGLVMGGVAPSMEVLVLGRVLQGLGGGSLPAVAYVCIGRSYGPAARPRMFALLSTAWVLPAVLGPAVAGVVGESLGWRWVFVGLLPLSAAIGGLALVAIRSIPAAAEPGEPAPVRRALLVAVGAALVLAGLGERDPLLAVPLVAAGVAIALPPFRALTPPGTLRARPGLPATVLSRGTLTFAFFASDAFVSLALTSVKGTTPAVAGVALAAASVCWTGGAWIQARLVGRLGPRRLVRVGFLLVAVGCTAFAVALLPAVPVPVGVATFGVAGLGIGLAYAPLSLTALASADRGREGRATSALQLCELSGTSLGTGVAGVLVAAGVAVAGTDGPGVVAALTLSTVVALLGTWVARGVPRAVPAT